MSEDRAARRRDVADLAEAIRRLSDAAVETAVGPEELRAAASAIREITGSLARQRHPDPYSGLLVAPDPDRPHDFDISRPEAPLPLSPVIGDCNPVRPEVHLEVREGRVTGTAVLGRKHIGPPTGAHGGVGAMIADQLLAVAPFVIPLGCVTRSMTVRYRRPLPLERELQLAAWCERIGDDAVKAWCTVSLDGTVLLEAEGDLLVALDISLPRASPPPA